MLNRFNGRCFSDGRLSARQKEWSFLLARFLKRPANELPIESAVSMSIPSDDDSRISPLAVIDPKARIAEDCEIGPFCTVGPDVVLGRGCRLISHVVITGHTTVGCNNVFFPNSVIGSVPQDKKFRGECSRLEIGDRNSIREAVTIHIGTAAGGGVTRVGDDNLLMVNVHLGHDCQIGNRNILGNNVMLAGHVVIGDNVVMSGAAAAHHYVTIGDYAFIAGMARIHHDVPPFVKVSDDDKIRAINVEGLRRAQFTAEDIEQIEEAGRKLFLKRGKTFAAALAGFDTLNGLHPQVKKMVEFLRRYLESLRPPKKPPIDKPPGDKPPGDKPLAV
jgi:UDP-N-acetylglucosamine acyltransferase